MRVRLTRPEAAMAAILELIEAAEPRVEITPYDPEGCGYIIDLPNGGAFRLETSEEESLERTNR